MEPHVIKVKIMWSFVVISLVMTSISMSESMIKWVVVFFTMMIEIIVEITVEVSMMIIVMWHGTRKIMMAERRINSMEWGVLKVEFIMLIVMMVESIRIMISWVSMMSECLMVTE